MNPSTPPMVQIVIAGLAGGALSAWFAWRSQTTLVRLLWVILMLGLLVPSGILGAGMNPWLVDARFRTYRVFYWSIRLGMSREEVLGLVQKHYPHGEARTAPRLAEDSETRLAFRMHPEHTSQPRREEISLRMQGGRVIGKNYAPNTLAGY